MTPRHLLVLERDAARRDELVALLRQAGHRAAAAPDGSAAALAIGVPGFDALVLDLAYPDLDVAKLREALAPATPGEPEPLDAAERRHIALTLRHTGGNRRRAAMLLGISRSTLLNKIRKFGLAVALALMVPGMRLGAQEAVGFSAAPVRSGTLSFDGHATAGDFVGTTSAVSGAMTASDSVAGVRGFVEAPVSSLATGNDHRDRDMAKSMEPERYPSMRFDLTGVTPGPAAGDTMPVTLHGTLALHGVTKTVALPAVIDRPAEGIHLHSDFPLDLKDYHIGGLSKMLGMLKMDEHIVVHVDVLFAS